MIKMNNDNSSGFVSVQDTIPKGFILNLEGEK